MTVSGLTMTRFARHSDQTRDSHTHSQRSAREAQAPRSPRASEDLKLVPQREHLELQGRA